jgi:hypothetical protein
MSPQNIKFFNFKIPRKTLKCKKFNGANREEMRGVKEDIDLYFTKL